MLFELLVYGTLLSQNGMAWGNNIRHRGEEAAVAQRQSLSNVTWKQELDMSLRRKCLELK